MSIMAGSRGSHGRGGSQRSLIQRSQDLCVSGLSLSAANQVEYNDARIEGVGTLEIFCSPDLIKAVSSFRILSLFVPSGLIRN